MNVEVRRKGVDKPDRHLLTSIGSLNRGGVGSRQQAEETCSQKRTAKKGCERHCNSRTKRVDESKIHSQLPNCKG